MFPFFQLIPQMKQAFDVEYITASHLNEKRCRRILLACSL